MTKKITSRVLDGIEDSNVSTIDYAYDQEVDCVSDALKGCHKEDESALINGELDVKVVDSNAEDGCHKEDESALINGDLDARPLVNGSHVRPVLSATIPTEKEIFGCYFCPASFSTPIRLETHQMVHVGVTQSQCRFCHFRFISLHHRGKHEMLVHGMAEGTTRNAS